MLSVKAHCCGDVSWSLLFSMQSTYGNHLVTLTRLSIAHAWIMLLRHSSSPCWHVKDHEPSGFSDCLALPYGTKSNSTTSSRPGVEYAALPGPVIHSWQSGHSVS